ncbi:MAG: transcriptional repressor [Chloroflexi bacterium]|nr:transcriptional repressor [Chloroflexota bacterium]
MSSTILDALSSRVEERGFRSTAPRRDVLTAVSQQRGPFSPEEIAAQLPMVGRATVYRTIRLLLDLGLVCRVPLEGGGVRYLVSVQGHHHHLVCISCGQIRDLGDCAVTEWVEKLAQRARYQLHGHMLEIYGRCERCQERARPVRAR